MKKYIPKEGLFSWRGFMILSVWPVLLLAHPKTSRLVAHLKLA